MEIDVDVVEPPAFGKAWIRGGSIVFLFNGISQDSHKSDDAPPSVSRVL